MANGSRRTTPCAPKAAAVVSEPSVAAAKTPCSQSAVWQTNGTVEARRPPNRKAEIGTPSAFDQSLSIHGHCEAGAVKREFGCAAFVPFSLASSGVQSLPCQSIACAGAGPMPSHQTSPSSVSATLVKIVFSASEAIALKFVLSFVPGATPKKPASGLIACRRVTPSAPLRGLIQAMSSPIVVIFQPASSFGGTSIAKFVL